MSTLKFHEYYREIPIPDNFSGKVLDMEGNPLKIISGISRVNVFVGANNSGKSRLLREIIRNKISPIYYDAPTKEILEKIIEQQIRNYNEILPSLPLNFKIKLRSPYQFTSNGTYIDEQEMFIRQLSNYDYNLSSYIADLKKIIENIGKINSINQEGMGSTANKGIADRMKYIVNELIKELTDYIPNELHNRIYIPALRTLRTFAAQSANSGLKNLTAEDYGLNFSGSRNKLDYESVHIENGEDFYLEIFNSRLSTLQNRKKIDEYETFISQNFFENRPIEIIPKRDPKNEVWIKVGDEKEQPIYHLGDGLQMLIILTFPLFLFDGGMVVIEEPELFIHPGLQKKFMDLLLNHDKAKNFMFFIASHSNHIIDFNENTEEFSIFTINKFLDPKENNDEKLSSIYLANVGFRDRDALSLLGVSNSSVYLANCTIWVEGPSDRLYLMQFIKVYLDHCRTDSKSKYRDLNIIEGIHYSFVYSGGDTIVHWSFDANTNLFDSEDRIIAKNLCGRALVIVDNDFGKNVQRKQMLEDELAFRFIQLPVVEIENLLSFEVIINTIKSYSTWKDLDLTNLKSLSPKKLMTKRIGSLIDDDILPTEQSIGKKHFPRGTLKKRGGYTINDKIGFCKKSLTHISYDNLTTEATNLVEQILDFIIENYKN